MTTLPDGRKVPEIGFGTYLIPPRETKQAVLNALSIGYRLIDTAACYFNELQTAEAIAEFLEKTPSVDRSEIIYTSKLWEDRFGSKAPRGIEESVENATAIGPIDLYLLHSPEGGREGRRQNWKALQDAVDAGKIKAIGVSNWSDAHLRDILEWEGLTVKPVINQIEINPWFQQNTIVDFCKKNSIGVEAYSPLTLGIKLDDPSVVKLAEKYHKTPAQILLRYAIDRQTIPLPKSLRSERIQENFEATAFKMDKTDVAALGDPNERFVTVPDWDPVTWS